MALMSANGDTDSCFFFQIHLTWILPSYVREYKSRPLDYLGWLIEHEGEGSLLSFLSQK